MSQPNVLRSLPTRFPFFTAFSSRLASRPVLLHWDPPSACAHWRPLGWNVVLSSLTALIVLNLVPNRAWGQSPASLPTAPPAGSSSPASPTPSSTPSQPRSRSLLLVQMDFTKRFYIDQQEVSLGQVRQAAEGFLQGSPNGQIVLYADRTLTFEDVAQVLASLRDVAGNRMGLAIPGNSAVGPSLVILAPVSEIAAPSESSSP